MSFSMLSRWPILVYVDIDPADVDDRGHLSLPAAERLFAAARQAYFAACSRLEPATVQAQAVRTSIGEAVVGSAGVSVSVNVTEVYPQRFTMECRVRPADDAGIAASATCSLSVAGGVSDALRDEFIALAHAARHMH